ncbi:MAG: 2,3-bisphosphoglycerate-independent phosphoglycerate mutase [Gammaproteobacteria bacterium]|nr:2,3-bisphosphoglycerate-independent phosphoglycerate mutase [Gammaproteobacteria bacterium]
MASTRPPLLKQHATLPPPQGPVVFVILDGVGVGARDEYDAVAAANIPTLEKLQATGLHRQLRAHGVSVGLPSDGDMGNSEVGHNILGAGRIFDQGAKSVDKAVESGTMWEGTWREMVSHLDADGGRLHLLGLLSDGNVHSHMAHLFALLDQARREGIPSVYVHVLLDGRDVPDRTAEQYVAQLEERLAAIRDDTGYDYRIASGGGRMVTTMDRYEADWRIVERGWQAHVLGSAEPFASAEAAITASRAATPGISDQQLPPFTVCDADGTPIGTIEDNDAVVFFNFRGDRAVEICQAFTAGDNFSGFERKRVPDVFFAGMMLYDGDLNIPENFLVTPEVVSNTISEYLAGTSLHQFACAETQKYGHVTYFWNGNRSAKFDPQTEEYLEIPSDQVSFDERPWMKSAETTDALIAALKEDRYRFIRANYAGGDMVGHTGSFRAAVIALESIDLALARLVPEVQARNGCLVITADHGNADDMVERAKDGAPLFDDGGMPRWRTSHSLNPVPLTIIDFSGREYALRTDLPKAGLANVAATIIELLGFAAPDEYEPSLLAL